VIVTSWVFREGRIDRARLAELVQRIGKGRLVLDLSCRKGGGHYWVVTNRWKSFTDTTVSAATLKDLAQSCAEFLIHAVDVEGLCQGVDMSLVEKLADWSPIPVTYAGGARSIEDMASVDLAGKGRVDLTIGSALDIFGGKGVRYADAVVFNQRKAQS
jgi:phosphoribosylformimino-5-aminoimidazole carboxamide ribotide isomerase